MTKIKGVFHCKVYNPDGTLDREFDLENGDTNAGLNNLLDVYFNGASQTTAWYLGLIDNAGYSSVSAADTMASHGGWVESTAYNEANRPQWTSGAASGGLVTNASSVNFTINGTVSIKGVFVTTSNAKGGTAGTLFATATGSVQTFTSGQVFKVTYTKQLTAQ